MLCDVCEKREICKKACPALKKHLKSLEVKQKHTPISYLIEGNDDLVNIVDWPEGIIELNTEDWVYFVKKYNVKGKIKKYLYLRYWKGFTFKEIGGLCNVSLQHIAQSIDRFKKPFQQS